jgi:hypothetical protein
VKREVSLPPRKYSRLAFFPSGAALIAVDEKGRAVVALESGETHELPEDANLRLFAFIGPDSLVYGRTELTELRLPGLESRPFTGPTPRITSLAGSPRHGRAYFASGADVYLVQRHFWNREGEASVERLRPWRLGPAKERRRRY